MIDQFELTFKCKGCQVENPVMFRIHTSEGKRLYVGATYVYVCLCGVENTIPKAEVRRRIIDLMRTKEFEDIR